MTPLRISVVIPTFNGARWVTDCLDSVLEQTHPPREVIVIDDGSTDGTPELLRSYGDRIVPLRQANAGIGAARNLGLARASGDYIAFLDDDDLWRQDKLEKQARYAAAHPEVDVLYTDAVEFDERGTVHESFFALFPGLRRKGDPFERIVNYCVPLPSTTMIKTAFLKRHRLSFIEPVSGVEDVGLFLEIAARGGVFDYLDEPLARRRLHDRNVSRNQHNKFAKRILLYEELLGRLAGGPPEHTRALRWGLRDAHFRLGEWFWSNRDGDKARGHFRQALAFDRRGLGALRHLGLTFLPAGAVQRAGAMFSYSKTCFGVPKHGTPQPEQG